MTPYAALQMSIAGGGNVSGGQVIAGNQTVQLSGTNTSGWVTQLWEIYDYPAGFATPAGWTLTASGILQSTAITPPVFTPPAAATLWGKYMFRLTVNSGLLNGVLMGPLSAQPLIDVASGVHVLSPKGQHDVCVGETNQFDAQRMTIGEVKASLRIIESNLGGGGAPPAGTGIPYDNAGAWGTTIANGSAGQYLQMVSGLPTWAYSPQDGEYRTARVVATANLTLSGTQTIDGVACVTGDRVAAFGQTTGSQNGIYVVTSGAWAYAADWATSLILPAVRIGISEGTFGAGSLWACTTAGPITVGTTALSFTNQVGGGSASPAALALDWTLAGVYTKTLAGGANTITFANAQDGQVIIVVLTGAASTVTWPTVKWAGGTVPTQTASGTDVYTFVKAGATIYGSVVQAMA